MSYKINFLLLLLLYLGSVSIAQAQNEDKKPSIKVDTELVVTKAPDEPGGEIVRTYFTWEAKNADHVLISGDDTIYPSSGRIEAGGSKIFIAVSSAGVDSKSIGSKLTSRPGPGRKGLIYNIDEDFNENEFFTNSYKYAHRTNYSQSKFADAALQVLQKRGYVADWHKIQSGPLVFTVNFIENIEVPNRTFEENSQGIVVSRRIGFVIFAKDQWLYVLPNVRKNFPIQDNKWKNDPSVGMGTNAAQTLAQDIVSFLQKL